MPNQGGTRSTWKSTGECCGTESSGTIDPRFLESGDSGGQNGEGSVCTLGFIRKGIEYKSWLIMMYLYKSVVRPQLEYHMQIWLLTVGRMSLI